MAKKNIVKTSHNESNESAFVHIFMVNYFWQSYAKSKLDGMYNVHCTHESERER